MRSTIGIVACALTAALSGFASSGHAAGLKAATLGVIYNLDEPASRDLARFYAVQRAIPAANLVGIHLPSSNAVSPEIFMPARDQVLRQLPTAVQSLLLVWSMPYAVGCMSVTAAFAAGYRAAVCKSACGRTEKNPMFDLEGWLPADTVGWWPAMLLPTKDRQLAEEVIRRGVASDGTAPPGTLYLVATQDAPRNVRAAGYAEAAQMLGRRIRTVRMTTPILSAVPDAIGYFTGVARVEELSQIQFRPGAAADHLTSTGGALFATDQMSVLAWLKQGATASYGSVSEPCNHPEKFPNPAVFFDHYTRGDTLLEAYWKSVAMPGQGLFIGEPLARPY